MHAPSAAQLELGFHTTYQTIPMPGRPDLFQVRVFTTPRTGETPLTTGQVARRLSLSVRQVNRLLNSGAIPSHRPGLLQHRVYQRDLDAYCRAHGIA